jgi:predicted ArsR family transcriptional regulator
VTQLSLLSPPPATYSAGTLAGRRNLETSRDAAVAIDRVLNERQLEVLKALVVLKSASADEVATAVGRRVTSVRPRMTECKARGFLALTDERRLTADGKLAQVYRLSRKGAEYLAENQAYVGHAANSGTR